MTEIILILFLFILIFSPLAFGTVELWSLTIMETASVSALIMLLLRNLKDKDRSLFEIPGIIPLLFLLTYVLLQAVPLPPDIIRIISPETYNLYKETMLVDQAGESWMSLSINKKAALMSFFQLAAYISFYVLTVQLLTKRDNLMKTVTIIVIFASILALFGILQHILSNNKIYWVRKLAQGGSLFGPYVNRNHYAGLMGMLFPLVISLFLFNKPHVTHKSVRDKITEIFNLQRTNIYLLLGFSSILIATSIFLTLSRSGIVSLCLSMIFFGLIFISKGAKKRRGIIIIVIFVLIVLSVGWFGWDPIFERFEKVRNPQGDISDLRFEIWKDSVNIIKDFPVTGTGFGSFVNIYPRYRTISGDRIADHAHNDYLEIFSDGGVIAFAICVWFLLVLVYKSYRTFLKRRELYCIYLFIAGMTGLISILFHGTTDFNLHIGANGLYFFFLTGLTVSAANTIMRDGLNDTYLEKIRLPIKSLTVLAGVILTGCIIFHIGIITGEVSFSAVKDTKLNEKESPAELMSIRDIAYRASLFDPLEARYPYAVANIEKLLSNKETAANSYKMSLQLDPVNGEYLQRVGFVMSEMKKYETADRLLQAGIKYDVSNPVRYKRYAIWLFSIGKKQEGLEVTEKAISMEPQKTREYITIMVLNGFSDYDILNALPERVEPHLLFADYLFRTGNDGMADEEYLHALQYLKNEEQKKESFFYEVYRYYMKKNRYSDALKVMQQAIEILPDNSGIRVTAGDLYEKLGLTSKAMEAYRHVLVIDPKNQSAQKKLDDLLLKNKGS